MVQPLPCTSLGISPPARFGCSPGQRRQEPSSGMTLDMSASPQAVSVAHVQEWPIRTGVDEPIADHWGDGSAMASLALAGMPPRENGGSVARLLILIRISCVSTNRPKPILMTLLSGIAATRSGI